MNSIPKTERIWARIYGKGRKNCHVITSKEDSRSMYYLYDCSGSEIRKLGRGKSPAELEQQWPLA